MIKERNLVYDRAKGIGILLLILGHLFTLYSIPFSIIFAFHMPLFFFISGLLFNPEKSTKNIVFSYLLPYIFFELFVGGVIVAIGSYVMNKSFLDVFKGVLHGMFWRIGSLTAMMESLWFLGVLSISLIICKYLIKFENKITDYQVRPLIILCLSLGAIYCSRLPIESLPLRLAAIPGAALIIYLSNSYGKYIISFSRRQNWWSIIILVILLLIVAISNKTVNISVPVFNDFYLYLAGAIIGIIITMWFSNRINSRFLEFLGRNSLILFAIHGIWLRGYAFLLSYIMGEKYMCMKNIPHILCIPGLIFVLVMSVITYFCIKDIYRIYFNSMRRIIKF